MSPNMPAAGWYADPQVPGQQRYWDGSTWTEHRSGGQPAAQPGPVPTGESTPVASPAGPVAPDQGAAPAAGPVKSRRPLWQTLVGAFVILLVGIGIGGAGGSGADADVKSATSKVTSLKSQLEAAKSENASLATQNSDLTTQANESKATADNALGEARKQAAAEYKKKNSALTAKSAALTARSKALDKRERKVSGMEHDWDANTVPGEGMYLVGSDIKPGTYKADASTGCYYARLSSINTSDIIDNNNVDGPVVIQVQPSDKALELSGCADFHKVG